ncbi:DUF7146 domain-containing protein [Brevundimonas diminuta]|uniref:Uncharacterized protein conserved in bacteria n=1 Tax=Brevundimonas diminuta TaxID=293 RepID=A0A2X1APN1_BREDI|nr:toprim domain-containing protein [Brevundimonas diminuta]SPU46617.1 Uncharacterized protein conserved in bacteria [Brevundimonas diminuta]
MSAPSFSSDSVAALALRLFGEPNRRLSSARELRFGRRGSLAVVPDRGVFHDYEAGVSGGVLAMVVHAGAAATTAEAAKLLEYCGELSRREDDDAKARRRLSEAQARADRIAAAGALWNAREGLTGTVVETYLRTARRIVAPLDRAALAFLPNAPAYPYRPDHHRRPAMAARICDGRGRFLGCHLTYLRPDGMGKARLTPARKMAGTVGGGHVRLIPGTRLVVAEGVESALSAWEAARDCEEASGEALGAVAALSAGGVSSLDWPEGTTGLIIAPDRDANGTGERAAKALARRASDHGLSVAFLYPPDGCGDWNDAAMKGGEA